VRQVGYFQEFSPPCYLSHLDPNKTPNKFFSPPDVQSLFPRYCDGQFQPEQNRCIDT